MVFAFFAVSGSLLVVVGVLFSGFSFVGAKTT